jgi:aryl-alcohol dehydrogenase-like predicted oxidoreductase
MTDFTERRKLGRTGILVSRMGLASGYNAPADAVHRAMDEHGINYFYWDRRRPAMASAIREIARTRRREMYIAVQSYDHLGFWLRGSVERALKKLGINYADILFLGWHGSMPGERVMKAASRLKESGKIRFIGFTGHNRKFHGQMAKDPLSPFEVQMVRYNAAHRGAERDVFYGLPDDRPGIVSYTATRWGKLLNPKKVPPGEKPPTATECYRFVLSNSAVDICLMGPKTMDEFEQGIKALKEGPLSEEKMLRIRLIGDFMHG